MHIVSIDRDACISCAACWLLCPELFIKERKDEKSAIQLRHRIEGRLGEGVVPGDLIQVATEAVDACPVPLRPPRLHPSPGSSRRSKPRSRRSTACHARSGSAA